MKGLNPTPVIKIVIVSMQQQRPILTKYIPQLKLFITIQLTLDTINMNFNSA
jgi:hypothetical protein